MISTFASLFVDGVDLLTLFEIVIAITIVWILVSIPVYIAGKAVAKGNATFGRAMGATLLGPIVYAVVLVATDFFLGGLFGSIGYVAGFVLAFIAWIGIYKLSFKTGWLAALAIAILAIIVFVVLLVIAGFLFGFLSPFLPAWSF